MDTAAGLDFVANGQKCLLLPKIEPRSSNPEVVYYTSRASPADLMRTAKIITYMFISIVCN
jgi:hypothetical protein